MANKKEQTEDAGKNPHVMSEKTRLLGLYEQLKNLGVHSIGDLEVLISRAD